MNAIRIVSKAELVRFIEETGWSATRLARASGLTTQAITRVTNGPRKRLGPDASEKVAPFLFGDQHPAMGDRRAAPDRRKSQRRKDDQKEVA